MKSSSSRGLIDNNYRLAYNKNVTQFTISCGKFENSKKLLIVYGNCVTTIWPTIRSFFIEACMEKLFGIEFDSGAIVDFHKTGLEIKGKLTKEESDKLGNFIQALAQRTPKQQTPKSQVDTLSVTLPIAKYLPPLKHKNYSEPSKIYNFIGRMGIYIIRQMGQVMYIGQSNDMLLRLRQHIFDKDTIGCAIKDTDNIEDWTIELIPIKERSELSKREVFYIKQLKPLFNVTYNN